MAVQTQVQMRRDTAANWTSTNPTLASGEWGLETDTRLMKIGDGTTAWNSLSYQLGPLLDEVIPTDPNGAYFTGSGLQMFGTTGNTASTPDAAALDITGDIDIRAKVSLTDWTPSVANVFVAKRTGPSTQWSYVFYVNTDGTLGFAWSANGTGAAVALVPASSVATGIADGATKWVRVTLDVDNGSTQNETKFWLSDDGTTWTQLGTTRTNSGVTSIFAGTAVLEIGSQYVGTNSLLNGTIYRAQILNGIGGTTAFDADFESVAADSFAFSESSANAATVTLTTTRYSFGLPQTTLTGTTTLATQANRTWYTPFTVRGKPITLKHFALESTTAPASNATVRLAIYNCDSQLQPTSRILESGAITVATGAAAIYRVRLTPTVLNPGNYLLALNSGVSFTARVWAGNPASAALNTMGANIADQYYVAATLSGNALPSTGTNWTTRNTANAAFKNFSLLGWS